VPRPKDKRIDALFVNIATNLQRARKKFGNKTQLEVATSVGCDPQMLARWERGDTQINAGYLKLLADHFGVPVDDFFDDDPKRLRISEGSGSRAPIARPLKAH